MFPGEILRCIFDSLSSWYGESFMKFPGQLIPEVLKSIFKPPATVKYPAEKADIPPDFRGKIIFDPKLCIGCKMCMRDCPAKAIHIEKIVAGTEKIFKATFFLDQCIYCAQCVDSCPKNALKSSPQFELAKYQRTQLKEVQQ
jgi:formate hydrogenlyase subunit 6/NADH:ubiquinone oxidoreductase subunit I